MNRSQYITAAEIGAIAGDRLESMGAIDRERWNALDLRSQIIWAGNIGIIDAATMRAFVGPGPGILRTEMAL